MIILSPPATFAQTYSHSRAVQNYIMESVSFMYRIFWGEDQKTKQAPKGERH